MINRVERMGWLIHVERIFRYKHGDEKTLITSLGSHKAASEAMISLEFNEDLEGLYVGCDLDSTLRVGMIHL
jgi:hypothetical protein